MPIPVGLAKLLIRTGIATSIPSIRKLMGDGLPYLKYYNGRILGSPNVELKATQELLDRATETTIDLSVGAPEGDPQWQPEIAIGAQAASGYPAVAGLPELRTAVAEKLTAANGIVVDPLHQVLICNGVSQGIGLMLDTFVDRGEKVAVFEPSYFMYRLSAQNRGAAVAFVPTTIDDGVLRFAERDLRRALRGCRVLLLNSPNNPTGGLFDRDGLERIVHWCNRHDVLIFSDEVYESFVFEGEHVSIGSLPGAENRTITANSFSKTYALASFRAGYLAGPRYLIQPMIVSFLATAPFVSTASQKMALAALRRPPGDVQRMIARFARRRLQVAAALKECGLSATPPAGAFYFWVDVASLNLNANEFCRRLLDEESILVMPGDSCGRHCSRMIRISFAINDEKLRMGLAKIQAFVGRARAESVPATIPIATASEPRPGRVRRAA